jgi:hypothetical protein
MADLWLFVVAPLAGAALAGVVNVALNGRMPKVAPPATPA